MGVTDCHVHINPIWEMRPEARALFGSRAEAADVEWYDREPARFLEYLDRCGVERAVLVNYVSPDIIGYTERVNEFVTEYAKADPDRLLPVGGVLPSHPDPGGEIRRLVRDHGLRGVKIHPPHQGFSPNAYRDGGLAGLKAIYTACESHGIPVIIHTGTSVFPGARNRSAQPMLVEDVAIDFPDLTIVLAHGGRPLWMDEAMFLVRRFPRVFLEVSSIPPARLLEYFPSLDRVREKVLFGSDWPGPGVRDIGENVRAFRALPLPDETKERILETNARVVFPARGVS